MLMDSKSDGVLIGLLPTWERQKFRHVSLYKCIWNVPGEHIAHIAEESFKGNGSSEFGHPKLMCFVYLDQQIARKFMKMIHPRETT